MKLHEGSLINHETIHVLDKSYLVEIRYYKENTTYPYRMFVDPPQISVCGNTKYDAMKMMKTTIKLIKGE